MTERHECPGVADDAAPGLDDGGGSGVAEGLVEVAFDGFAVRRQRAAAVVVHGREPAAQVEDPGAQTALARQLEHVGRGSDGGAPGLGVALLRTDVEGHACGVEPKLVREGEHLDGLVGRAAVLAGQRPVRAVAGGDQPAQDLAARRRLRRPCGSRPASRRRTAAHPARPTRRCGRVA